MAADEITETLGIARSNVSTSICELLSWNLISLSHVMGDRRDHFTAKEDTWDILMTIVEGRKQREIDPTIAMLRDCREAAAADQETPEQVRERIENMLGFVENMTGWYEQVSKIPRTRLEKLMRLGAKVANFVSK